MKTVDQLHLTAHSGLTRLTVPAFIGGDKTEILRLRFGTLSNTSRNSTLKLVRSCSISVGPSNRRHWAYLLHLDIGSRGRRQDLLNLPHQIGTMKYRRNF